MLSGVNDSLADARRLAELLRPVECKVNLIVFNPHEGTRFRPSEQDQILAFRSAVLAFSYFSAAVCMHRTA